jgi:hypothetical protein
LINRFSHTIPLLKTLRLKLLVLALALLPLTPEAGAQQQQANAAQIKATFLYHFSSFVEWPPGSFTDRNAPLVIGVLGPDPFGAFLDELVENEKANGHPITVQRFNNVKDVGRCHILFINTAQPAEAIKALGNRSILSVGDSDNFIRSGGIVRFMLEKGKIRLEINMTAARQANLNISSKLLRLAKTVE